jgi:hypothetical protein
MGTEMLKWGTAFVNGKAVIFLGWVKSGNSLECTDVSITIIRKPGAAGAPIPFRISNIRPGKKGGLNPQATKAKDRGGDC